MIVSNLISGSWAISLGWLYVQIWLKKWEDGSLLPETSKWEEKFLIAAIPFLLLKLLPFVMSFVSLNFNLFNKKNHRTCDLLTNQIYVGRGLRESLFDSMKYSMFWGVILLVKFSFSYLEQIQPSVKMTKQLLNLHSAENHGYNNVFTKGNGLSIGLIWLPTVLIYLMDLQIWYTLCSFLVGVTVGLFSRLGVIQNIIQLRHRFHQFVWQVVCKFNFIPKECSSQGTGNNGWVILRNWTNPQFVKGISDHVMVGKFALMWNEIVTAFREEDIISDNEFELLVFPSDSWKVGVVMWPCFLLSNNIILAVGEIQKFADAPDDWVHRKIFKEEFTRCAIIEAYDSVKNLLLERIMDPQTEEHSLVKSCFQHVEYCVGLGKFTKVFNMEKLQQIYTAVVGVVESLIIAERDLYQVVNALQILYHVFVHEFIREEGTGIQVLRRDGLAPHCCNSMLFHNAVNLPDSSNVNFAQQIQRLYTILTTRDSMENIPANDEARCRITFFCNSLFMGIPKSPPLEKMKAFSVLTPYYKESVLYSEEELRSQNEDGISILYYLQTVYNDDWKNFMERMRREGMEDDNDIWTIKLRDLRLWASYRGQILARTVRGMMHYGRAIQLLSFLESLPFTGSRGAEVMPAEESVFVGNHRQDIARMKFTYLVTCQNYGHDKETMDPRADDIRYLMEEYDALLVAYVDEVWEKDEHYSVLTRYDQALQKEVEVYRIKLPGPFKLGCGKPENQNHAIIFTRGDALQTIDMNQDNYFEEALKMGSLLEEFDACYGIRKPTIAGVREHIFTASVSSLAWFMSAQETGFVTSGQRVLANPLKVRMHYGHPDVFDRIWILTRGGVSKASRMINICEDIFAGFNCTSRGGNITHHEYLQIGKGRDVGLNQISMFEAKIAGGSAEQLLSRDVHRLGNKLDFFRMLSFYHSTVGFYLSNVMVIWTMYTLFWGDLYMALSGAENFRMGLHSNDIRAVLEIQFLQLVLMTGCPMIVDGSVERKKRLGVNTGLPTGNFKSRRRKSGKNIQASEKHPIANQKERSE
ncbi:hypothetical protein SAY87_030716 [Trapa incisa]|uniref:1,3-beta-glucan synthase n=1 Tax=Trapa incisa TaxID=236973 RepID=A0AAN7KPZ4_9MYRT|nr:hypothetical protein SAY87_030716 [Trapa incisa]